MSDINKIDNSLYSICTARSLSDLDSSVTEAFKSIGVTLFTYTSTLLQGNFITTYPEEFKKEYVEKEFLNIDPVIHKASMGQTFYWSSEMFRNEVFKVSRMFGIDEGWTFSSKGDFGWSSVTIADKQKVQRWNTCCEDSSVFMNQYMGLINTKVREINFMDQEKINYSEREIECLKWARYGKTIEETSRIMGLSVRTINFYLKNSYDKMGVDNKTAAVSRAILSGII